jgi:hypothetical protein
MMPSIGPAELLLVGLICAGALLVPVGLFAAMYVVLQRQKRIEEKLDSAGQRADDQRGGRSDVE